jgi:hypothetical protein
VTRPSAPKLKVIGSLHQAVRMLCAQPVDLKEEVCAYVAGIRIGSSPIEGTFEPGDIIEYPVTYLPWVELPAEIRFVSERSGEEVCDPLRLSSHYEAVALVGVGEAVVQTVAIDQGMIRGLVINRVNGLIRPQMFARINGVVPRTITVEQPRLLDDGGASFQFSAQLHPADLGENGLTAEIFLLGRDTPLTTVAFRRADVDDLTKRIVEFEARLAQMGQSNMVRFKAMDQELSERVDVLQQRIDAFIEYAASFMFDRVAAREVQATPGAEPLQPALREKVDAFLALVHGGGRTARPSDEREVALPLASTAFSFGWHEVEQVEDCLVRWMSDHGVLFNPHPERVVEEVRLTLAAAQGTTQPVLRAAFDQRPAVLRLDPGGAAGMASAVILWPKGREASTVEAVSLASMLHLPAVGDAGGRPARTQSIAVSSVTFVYAVARSQQPKAQSRVSAKRIA